MLGHASAAAKKTNLRKSDETNQQTVDTLGTWKQLEQKHLSRIYPDPRLRLRLLPDLLRLRRRLNPYLQE